MADDQLIGDEYVPTAEQLARQGALPISSDGSEPLDFLKSQRPSKSQINTLSPGPNNPYRRSQAETQDFTSVRPPNSTGDDELLRFRMMLMEAKANNNKALLNAAEMAPSKPVSVQVDLPQMQSSGRVTNSRLNSMGSDPAAWARKQAQMRQLKDLNFILLGVAVGSVLLLAAVVLYMYQ